MNAPVPVRAAITAAGASRRMGRPKALLPWGRGTVLSTIVETLERAGCSRPLVVLGANADVVGEEARRVGATPMDNADWEQGRFGSIRLAAQWALRQSAALLLWPVDCPGVDTKTVLELTTRAGRNPAANLVPCHAGRGGHPVLICPVTLAAIAATTGDANLRDFLDREPASRLEIEVEDRAITWNLNRPAEYESANLGSEVNP